MKRAIFLLTAVLLCGSGYAQISSFPYNEGFEDNGKNLPPNWSQQQVSEATGEYGTTKVWEIGLKDDYSFSPNTVHGGSYKAVFGTDYTGGSVAKLITPTFDLSGVVNPQLKFWRTSQSLIGVNTLKVYYQTAQSNDWILLATFDAAADDWQQETVDLPNPSSGYRIAFEGHDNAGFGIQLDDIKIAPAPTGPVIGENPTLLNMGIVYNNLPFGGYTKDYTVKNTGVTDLVITSLGRGTDVNLSSNSLPLTVKPGESSAITVLLNNPNSLNTGFFNGKLVLMSNDADNPEFKIDVTAQVAAANVSTYINEEFGTQFGQVPADWGFTNVGFLPSTTGGVDDSPCISAFFNTPGTKEVQTGYVSMGINPSMSFCYKILQQPNGGFDHTDPIPAEAFSYSVSISKDNGSTWEAIAIAPSKHSASTEFTQVTADVSKFANEICLVKIAFDINGSLNNPKIFFDNVVVGTVATNDLKAVAVSGSSTPVVGTQCEYIVSVTNSGISSQSDYSVRLMRESDGGDIEIASCPGVAIAQGETKEFTLVWTPTVEGSVNLYGEVVADKDEFEINNKTDLFLVTVQPGAYKSVRVGDGNEEYYFLP